MITIQLHKDSLASKSEPVKNADCLIFPVSSETIANPQRIAGQLAQLNTISSGVLRRIFEQGDFKANTNNVLWLPSLAGVDSRVLLFGTGKPMPNEQLYDNALKAVFKYLSSTEVKRVAFFLTDVVVDGRDSVWQLQQMSMRAEFNNYRYTHTRPSKRKVTQLEHIDVMDMDNNSTHRRAVKQGLAIAAGMRTARDLGDLPGNICTPEYMAGRAEEIAKELPALKARVFNEKKIRELKMGALLSVSRGSAQPPYVVILEYYGADKSQQPVALVGKGVCFDTGGISIKPSSAMDEMKYDMCGASCVIGVLETVARLELPINVIGIVGAVENMPSDRATKPGDVVTSLSGKTIEVLNTDAEGRMVLCDLLHYVKQYKPACIVDIATLTGACVVALGKHAAGLYSNQQDLAERLLKAGVDTVDRAWQLPLWPEYKKELRSNFADIANVGGRYAGSISAACFLYEFVGSEWSWAHLDIAGVAWHSGNAKGGTGRPVPLLSQFLIDYSPPKVVDAD